MKYLILLSFVLFLGCGNSELKECSSEKVGNKITVVCGLNYFTFTVEDGEVGDKGDKGEDGLDGKDSIIEIIDPCGYSGFDEVIFRLSDNTLIAYFEVGDNRFLTVLEPGVYRTTDSQRCLFEVTEDYEVIEL